MSQARNTHPYRSAVQLTPGGRAQSGDGVFISRSSAGNVMLQLVGGGVIEFPASVGPNLIDDLSVVDAPAAGTTATAKVYNLYR